MSNAAMNRPTGVMLPQNQLAEKKGEPRTITGFAEAKNYGIEYTDDSGVTHITIAMCIGGQWYLPPNGENYAATLRPLKGDTWLTKMLEERRAIDTATASGDVPKQDNVDILGR